MPAKQRGTGLGRESLPRERLTPGKCTQEGEGSGRESLALMRMYAVMASPAGGVRKAKAVH